MEFKKQKIILLKNRGKIIAVPSVDFNLQHNAKIKIILLGNLPKRYSRFCAESNSIFVKKLLHNYPARVLFIVNCNTALNIMII